MLASLLAERIVGSQVQCAKDSDSALSAARTFEPSHVFLDMNVPGAVGFSLLVALRAVVPKASFAILSGDDRPETVRAAFENEVYGYIPKRLGGEGLINACAVFVQCGVWLPRDIVEATPDRR